MGMKLKIASLNVRGLLDKTKRHNIFHWLTTNNIDIALLQETYCDENLNMHFQKSWDGKMFHSYTTSSHSKGV